MNLLVNGSKSVLESFQCYYQSKLTVKYLVPGPSKEPLDLGRYHVTAPQEASGRQKYSCSVHLRTIITIILPASYFFSPFLITKQRARCGNI